MSERILPLLLPIPQTAAELSTSISTVYAMIGDGRLDLVKLGPKTSRITSESIARVLESRGEPAVNVPNLKQFKNSKVVSRPTSGG
jgi:predicted DNA-binding transcriptional regulator AlpA